MVTITNGIKTFRVPAGAAKPYESMGFRVVSDAELEGMRHAEREHHDDSGEPMQNDTDSTESGGDGITDEKTQEDIFVEELLEKPLSQWSNDEVKEFVRIKEIDTSGAQKVSQVRGIIKAYLEEQNKNA